MPSLLLATDVAELTPFSETHLTVRLVLGVLLTLGALSLAAWRGNQIFQTIRSGQPAVGEATPTYLAETEALDRMATTIPEARLVAILRDPVDRAYSHYWMEHVRGRDDRTFADAAGDYLERVRALTKLPVCAGFGVRRAEQVRNLAPHTDGVIVGSALVEHLEAGNDPVEFLRGLRPAP